MKAETDSMTGGTPIPGSGHLDDRQRRVHRSPVLFTTPVVLLAVLTVMALWETIRGNITGPSGNHWPWRLALLDQEALSSLLAVSLGFVFARAQFARAVRPIIGWNGYVSSDLPTMNGRFVWVVGIRNGGMHSGALESLEYHVQPKGEMTPAADIQWQGYEATVTELEALGLRLGKDFDLNALGAGTPIGVTTDRDGLYAVRLSVPALSLLDNLYIRIRVTDAVGDTHERILHCLRAAEVEIRSAVAAAEGS
ncbi:hypothetical protein [Streptomyces sp. NPDC001381]|uniref:hypothetical protein n=1 Tax=Streptomyces sp. NPDC001381 TaxID=3364567 RepID=UPI0036A5EB55